MTKESSTLPLVLPARRDGVPAQRWLYAALQRGILDGSLPPGRRLPATRELAAQYHLARGTIVAAFDQLRSEGYLEGRTGSGTFVARELPAPRGLPHQAGAAPRPPERHLSRFAALVEPFPLKGSRPLRAFRANQPALDLFPTDRWARVAARRVRRATVRHLEGDPPMGHPPLREAVADYLITSRGVRCTAEQVVIVSGVQEALSLVARLVLDPGDRVVMENPGYIGARLAFQSLASRIQRAPVDDQGLVLRPEHAGARLAYITPAHQFPLGMSMSLARRLELLAFARAHGCLIFEDDYDSEYRFRGRPLPALQGLDADGVVVFAGSFSKVLFPALRLGYVVLPPDLLDRVAAAAYITSRHVPTLEQAVLCDFITEGHFARHIRRMRQVYAERLGVLLEASQQRLAGLLDVSDVEAGLQTSGWLAPGIAEDDAVAAAAARRVEVTPLGEYTTGRPGRAGLQLGFAAVDPAEIRRGVRDLASALEPLARRRQGRAKVESR